MSVEPIRPDIPPERYADITALSVNVNETIAAMIQKAWQEGIREGLEVAAQISETAATMTRDLPILTDFHCAQIAMAEFLRDQNRLASLQVGEPQ